MSKVAERALAVWIEMLDHDFDAVIAGRIPNNDDLVPLAGFVTDLKSLNRHPSPILVDLHSSMSASTARAHREIVETRRPSQPKRSVARSIRRRAVALAASLAMISGMTGLAWAADNAGPGDWLYGLDRALESIGIGAGGAEERLLELADVSPSNVGTVTAESSAVEAAGLERAAQAITTNGSLQAQDIHVEVFAILEHLGMPGKADGHTIAEIAKTIGADRRSTDTGRTPDAGKPTQPGKP